MTNSWNLRFTKPLVDQTPVQPDPVAHFFLTHGCTVDRTEFPWLSRPLCQLDADSFLTRPSKKYPQTSKTDPKHLKTDTFQENVKIFERIRTPPNPFEILISNVCGGCFGDGLPPCLRSHLETKAAMLTRLLHTGSGRNFLCFIFALLRFQLVWNIFPSHHESSDVPCGQIGP